MIFSRTPSLRVWVSVVAAVVGCAGCHRSYYRQQADVDAGNLIQEKINHPHWDLPRQGIEIDPRSRMFDPFAPDFEPMPLDDPYSHELMHNIDGKKGWRKWHQFGDTDSSENPDWRDFLPMDDNGVLVVNADQAYQLSLIHSRDYQSQFETLYLSALDVSAERFRFDTQFFGGYSAFYTVSGADRDHQQNLNLSMFTQQTGRVAPPTGISASPPVTNGVLARKYFATGSELAVGIANSLNWNFLGPDDYSSLTIVDFGMIQPLLRLAGRERVLEQLTLSERRLLSNVRQMERYRQAFFVEIMTGRNAGNGATRSGGFFGGAGLEGFTGVGGGGFGRVGQNQTAGGGQGNATLTIPRAGGFLGLLQSLQDIRIQKANIAGLRTNLTQLRESLRENLTKIPDDPESIVRDRLQIAQARQALLNAETRLLTAQTTYQQTLDQYKVQQMGLPPTLCIALSDNMLDRFNLIDPVILPTQTELTNLRDEIGFANERLLGLVKQKEMDGQLVQTLDWSDEVERQLRLIRSRLVRVRELRRELETEQMQRVQVDIENLKVALPGRRQEVERLRKKYVEQRDHWENYGGLDPCQVKLAADIDPAVFDARRLESLEVELSKEVLRLHDELASLQAPITAVDAMLEELLQMPTKPPPADLYRQIETQVVFRIPEILSDLAADTLDLSLLQARARVDSVALTPIDMPSDLAIEIARRYRHDWMNARAALVDSWRLIYFNADALQSTLDVVFSGDIRNTGDNPFHLTRRQGQLKVGLQWDGPWTRLRERNTYRQALIEYQQARRNFYAFEDALAGNLRDTIRTIDLNQLNFEERRLAVLSAIEQIVLNDEIQKFREERGLASGATAARDAVSALTDLQEAQNLFLGIWVNYEALRMILDLDLGTMQLDGEGNWVDPGPIGTDYGLRLPEWDLEGPDLFFPPSLVPPTGIPEAVPPGEPLPKPLPQPPAIPVTQSTPNAQSIGSELRIGKLDADNVLPATFLEPAQMSRVIRLPPVHREEWSVPYLNRPLDR